VGPSGAVTVFLWAWYQWSPEAPVLFDDARLIVE
jgi:hypothetical protein